MASGPTLPLGQPGRSGVAVCLEEKALSYTLLTVTKVGEDGELFLGFTALIGTGR